MLRRTLIPALLLAACQLSATPAAAWAADPRDESDLLKAAFVYNFAKYVQWPERPDRALQLCLLGDDEIFPALRRLQGQQVRGTDVAIHPLNSDAPSDATGEGCDILFVGESEGGSVEARLRPLSGRPVLTISDIPRFAERGGVISLFRDGKKIRFAVNLQAARAAGLRISSRLLNLARIVDPNNGEE